MKGTTFTVSVRPEGAAVHVTAGAVQVAARGSQRAVIVRPGQTGSVSSKPGAEVEVRKREGKAKPAASENAQSETAEQAANENSQGEGNANSGEKGNSAEKGNSGEKGNSADKGNSGNKGNG
ncbi:MAG: hypothetical protein QF521_25130, partial [Alphaproteobacteria bacterium]|nr:hypothetical protein [Alphaproteobacteria bacterium]